MEKSSESAFLQSVDSIFDFLPAITSRNAIMAAVVAAPPPSASHPSAEAGPSSSASRAETIQLAFDGYRAEIDGHNDRRERLIKASRDITNMSKK